jgi:hypothetical protein
VICEDEYYSPLESSILFLCFSSPPFQLEDIQDSNLTRCKGGVMLAKVSEDTGTNQGSDESHEVLTVGGFYLYYSNARLE